MSTIVRCPDCQRKLKVGEAALGRSVKCTCGNVFKALADNAVAPAADVLIVACTSCGTKLKVPESSRGRKMKCSKCATVFVAGAAGGPPPLPLATPVALPDADPLMETDDSEARSPFLDYEAEETQPDAPLAVDEPIIEDEEEEMPPARVRSRAPAAATTRPAAATGVGGYLLNWLVALIVVAYLAVLLPTYLGYLDWVPFPQPAATPAIRGNPAFQINPEPRPHNEQ